MSSCQFFSITFLLPLHQPAAERRRVHTGENQCGVLYATTLRRTATVVGNRGNVAKQGHPHTDVLKCAKRGLAARTGTFHENGDRLHAEVLSLAGGILSGELRSERRALARSAEAGAPGGRPCKRITLPVGNGDDGVCVSVCLSVCVCVCVVMVCVCVYACVWR